MRAKETEISAAPCGICGSGRTLRFHMRSMKQGSTMFQQCRYNNATHSDIDERCLPGRRRRPGRRMRRRRQRTARSVIQRRSPGQQQQPPLRAGWEYREAPSSAAFDATAAHARSRRTSPPGSTTHPENNVQCRLTSAIKKNTYKNIELAKSDARIRWPTQGMLQNNTV